MNEDFIRQFIEDSLNEYFSKNKTTTLCDGDGCREIENNGYQIDCLSELKLIIEVLSNKTYRL